MDFGFVDGFISDNGGTLFPETDFRDTNKTAKICSSQRSNGSGSADPRPQMLCFSSSPATSPYYHQSSYGFAGNVQRGVLSGAGGPFTPSQWMELEHQALIYKYITANVAVPSYLLNPIRKAFESVGFSGFAGLTSNALGWGAFHLGFANTDPEPGRCRRTDGKKWRCSRDAVIDQKYCERHMNRGRHRSRKPVEGRSGQPATRISGGKPTTATASSPSAASNAAVSSHPSGIPNITRDDHKRVKDLEDESSFGSVCSDSLLNPLNRSSSLVSKSNHLRQFMDEWPDETNLSISIPSHEKTTASSPRELEMGLAVGPRQVEGNWVPASWEGGPLGEALHTAGECKTTKQLNLIGAWDSSSPRIASSPTGVLQMGSFGSLSSSPRAGLCNGLIGSGLMNPSLPSL